MIAQRPHTNFEGDAGCAHIPGMEGARTHREILPGGLAPRVFSRVEAARYVGIGTTTFDRAIRDRIMPPPFKLYGRRLWDRQALDAAIEALRDAQEPEGADDSWADYS